MKEIALRKVVGSSRGHIFLQIILESVITSLFALLLAFAILRFLIPQFSGLGFISEANISFHTNIKIILLFVAFAVIAGLVAGVLPAIVLSRVKPLMLMQRLQNLKLFRHLGLRKALLVIQFMISIVFISMVTVTYRQLSYAVNINFGTHQTHIFNIPLQGMDYAKAEQEFSKISGVEKISAISNLMGNYSDMGDDIRIDKDKDPVTVRQYFTDENYISNMQLRLVAGANFPANHVQQHEQFAIVNETFVRQFQLGAPMLMRYDSKNWSILNLSIASGNTIQTTSQLEAVWKKLDPYHSFQGRFYSEEVQAVFSDIQDIVWMVAFLSILGVVIACLGLLGITLFTVQSKAKEISIRKVIGASPLALMKLLLRSYLQVMIIAVCVAIPVAIFLSNMLLQEMSQRISLNAGLFIPGVTIIMLLSLITIGSQTLKAVLVNPVKGLRTE